MNLQTRARNMVMNPAAEWPVVASESTTVQDLLLGYAAPLSAIGAICRFIGFSFVGVFGYRIGIFSGLSSAIVSWVLGLVACFVAALVIEQLAPQFHSRGNRVQALKLVVFSFTPIWLAGVLSLIPSLSVLTIIAALYAIYVFYLGVPKLMATPESQVIPYMAVSAIVIIVIYVIIGTVTGVTTGVARMY
jgi:hypothetical protein